MRLVPGEDGALSQFSDPLSEMPVGQLEMRIAVEKLHAPNRWISLLPHASSAETGSDLYS
jgi:hypothetical protein